MVIGTNCKDDIVTYNTSSSMAMLGQERLFTHDDEVSPGIIQAHNKHIVKGRGVGDQQMREPHAEFRPIPASELFAATTGLHLNPAQAAVRVLDNEDVITTINLGYRAVVAAEKELRHHDELTASTQVERSRRPPSAHEASAWTVSRVPATGSMISTPPSSRS